MNTGPRPGQSIEARPRQVRSEPANNPPRRTRDQLRAEILAALADGPLMKWELRDRLHEPEVHVLECLRGLKDDRQVKVVGSATDKRKWALLTWQPPFSTVPAVKPKAPKTKPEPELRSWWTDFADPASDFSAFTAAAKQRDLEAGWTKNWDRTRPSALEYRE